METRSIAVIAYRASSSGIATFTYQLSKALALGGHEVLLPAFGMSSRLKSELGASGVVVLDLGRDPKELGYLGGPLIEYSILSRKVRKLLEVTKWNPDVIIFTIPGFALRFKCNYFFVTAWGHLELLHKIDVSLRYLNPQLRLFAVQAILEYWLMDHKAFKESAGILCLTSASFQFFREKFGRKVSCISPPMEAQEIKRTPSSKIRILFVSRDLSLPRKNLSTLLLALSLLSDEHLRKLQLTLVGSKGERYRSQLEHLKLKGLDVEVKGYVDRAKMQNVYADSDVLVYISNYEELGYALLEGMAHGLAVIASDIPSFKDMVLDGRNGFLIDPGDYKTLAKRIANLSGDRELCLRLGAESLRIIKEKFDPRLTVRCVQAIMSQR